MIRIEISDIPCCFNCWKFSLSGLWTGAVLDILESVENSGGVLDDQSIGLCTRASSHGCKNIASLVLIGLGLKGGSGNITDRLGIGLPKELTQFHIMRGSKTLTSVPRVFKDLETVMASLANAPAAYITASALGLVPPTVPASPETAAAGSEPEADAEGVDFAAAGLVGVALTLLGLAALDDAAAFFTGTNGTATEMPIKVEAMITRNFMLAVGGREQDRLLN